MQFLFPFKDGGYQHPKKPLFFFSFLPSTLSALFSRERAAGTNQTQHGGGEEEEEEAEPHCYSSFHIYGEGGRARNCPRHPKKSPFLFLPPTPGGKRERAFSWHPPPPACWVGLGWGLGRNARGVEEELGSFVQLGGSPPSKKDKNQKEVWSPASPRLALPVVISGTQQFFPFPGGEGDFSLSPCLVHSLLTRDLDSFFCAALLEEEEACNY